MKSIQPRSRCPARLRPPTLDDGQAIHRLITNSPPLDRNSVYAYLLQGLHHAATCVVADGDDGLAGYVSAYIPPQQADTLFIWQMVVASSWRGEGLAQAMLHHLLARRVHGVRWLETTITPDNVASLATFQALARQLDIGIEAVGALGGALFPEPDHPAEILYRLGPLPDAAD